MEAQEKGNVSLREYVDFQIAATIRTIRHLKKRIKVKDVLDDKALKLQFDEYERRLTALNHEAQRLSLMIPRTEFDIALTNLSKEINEISNTVKTIQLWVSNQEGKQSRAQWISIIATLISLVALLMTMFSK